MTRSLPLVRLEGGPREWGLAHGRAVRPLVAHNVRAYMRRFREGAGLSPAEIRNRAESYRRVIAEASPGYAAAMEGIAQGAGQDPLDVVAMNVRYELLYSEFARVGMERERAALSAVGGCTSFAVMPDRTANGHLLVGQNWDWLPEIRGAVLRATDEDGVESLSFTEAGIAGAKIGLNAAGLALAVNGLVSDRDRWSRVRKPFHVRCWEILRARTLDAALRAATEGERPCSANFLLARAGRKPRVVDIEAAPDGVCELGPSDGFLVHANHFTDPESLGIRQPLAEDRESSYRRAARMDTMVRARLDRGRGIRVDDLKRMLRDHDGARLSVCRHPDPARPPDERFETRVSVVMDVDAGEMFLAAGRPCTTRYRRYSLRVAS